MHDNSEASTIGLPAPEHDFSAGSVIAAIVAGVAGAFILSWIYGPIEHYSPIAYLNIIITYGMGWLVGKVSRAMIRKKKIYKPVPAVLVGAMSGFFAVWFSWLTYLWVIFDYNFKAYFDLLPNPWLIVRVANYLAHDPVWSLGKGGDPAIMYYAAWVAELAIIVGLPGKMCLDFVRENFRCGKCGEWVKATGDLAVFAIPDDSRPERLQAIAGGDLSALVSLSRPEPEVEIDEWLEVTGHACADCPDEDGFVNIAQVVLQYNKKSKKMERRQKMLARFVKADVDMEKKIFEPSGGHGAGAVSQAVPVGLAGSSAANE